MRRAHSAHVAPEDVSAASATEWTSAYSGTLDVDGGLRMGNGCDEQDTPQYVLVCGISLSRDDDTSVLAFTSDRGDDNACSR